MWTSGCARVAPAVFAPPAVAKALTGKTKEQVLACTNITPDERTVGNLTDLIFYKEASLLEESFPVSKSSMAQVHHGCLAHVRLKDGRAQEIHYHPVPQSYAGYDHCDSIFESCLAVP
jgi:hypothetical protein